MANHTKRPVVQKLRFGIDIDGTITQAPKHFKRLIDSLRESKNCVFIITGRDAGRRAETEQFLKSMCINYDELVMKPIDWPLTMPEWKVLAVHQTRVQLMFDDEEANCWAIQQQTQCLAAHALPIPEMGEEIRDLREESHRIEAGGMEGITT